jgi:hypothetical protein
MSLALMPGPPRILRRTLVLCVALVCVACGGSKETPTTPTPAGASTPTPSLSATRADSVADAVNQAILEAILALADSFEELSTARANGVLRILEAVDLPPVHTQKACANGGLSTLDGTSRMTDYPDGRVEMSTDVRIGFADCASPGVTLHSDPYLTLSMLLAGTVEAPNHMTLQIRDGVAFTVDGVRGRVRYNCTQAGDLSGKVPAISGSMTWEYPIGTVVTGPGCTD